MIITFPIDVSTEEGIEAIRFLLSEGLSTPKLICDVVEGVTLVEDCVVVDDAPYLVDDGNAELEYSYDDYSPREAAEAYVSGGEWGDDLSGSINVSVWRVGIDENGEDCSVEEEDFDIDLASVLDHATAIIEATDGDGCGSDPDDHDWTSQGEGGLDTNPGVWSTGGTSMVFKSHCRACGLHRTQYHAGSQRNPGQGDSVAYRMLDEDEITWHRKNGSMNDINEA